MFKFLPMAPKSLRHQCRMCTCTPDLVPRIQPRVHWVTHCLKITSRALNLWVTSRVHQSTRPIQLMCPGQMLSRLKLVSRLDPPSRKRLFMIGVKLHTYLRMGKYHKSYFKSLTQLNTTTWSSDWRKISMKNTSPSTWGTCTWIYLITLAEMILVVSSQMRIGPLSPVDWTVSSPRSKRRGLELWGAGRREERSSCPGLLCSSLKRGKNLRKIHFGRRCSWTILIVIPLMAQLVSMTRNSESKCPLWKIRMIKSKELSGKTIDFWNRLDNRKNRTKILNCLWSTLINLSRQQQRTFQLKRPQVSAPDLAA